MAKARDHDVPAPAGLLGGKAIPPFAALRAFEAVGREGGIRKAAGALSLDHAVVSRHIRLLEQWLGITLFRRVGSNLIFTDAGKQYHARVTQAMVELALATSDLLDRENQHRLRVWCVPGFAIQWLADQLARFEDLHPEFEIELRPTDGPADLVMHEADVDIRFYGDDWPPSPMGKGLRHVELARPPIMAVASPTVAARLNAMSCVDELAREPLLHEEHHEQWRLWLQRNGARSTSDLQGPLLWHAHHAIAAARLSRGVALASTYLVAKDLAQGDLAEARVPGTRPVAIGAYCFVARADRWSLPGVAKLRRFLVDRAAY